MTDRGLLLIDRLEKRSEDSLDFFIDLWAWLEPSEVVAGARAWAEPGDLRIYKLEYADAGVLVWAADGVDRSSNTVFCRVTTSAGRSKLVRFKVYTRGTPSSGPTASSERVIVSISTSGQGAPVPPSGGA